MPVEPLQLQYASPRRRNPLSDPPARGFLSELMHWIGSTTAWTFATLVLLTIPLGWILYLTGPVIGFPGIVLAVMLFPMLAMAARSVRRRRAAAVLGYLQQAVRLNLPLNRVLQAAAMSERGKLKSRLWELREELEASVPLADAIAHCVPEMSLRAIGLIQFAESAGRLPQTLDRLVSEERQASRRFYQSDSFATWYAPVFLVAVGLIITLMGIIVIPKFTRLFEDFHVRLPGITRFALQYWDWMAMATPIIAVVLLLMCAVRLRETLHIRRPSWLFRGPLDGVMWSMPIYHRLIRDRNLSDICSVLADSVELGYPLEQALMHAQQMDLNRVVQLKLSVWASGVTNGLSADDAARQAGMPKLLVGMISSGNDAASLTEALRFTARFYHSQFSRRYELLRGAGVPVITLLMGLMVLAVALSLFLPMRELIMVSGPYVRTW